jgi:hypothetical protein
MIDASDASSRRPHENPPERIMKFTRLILATAFAALPFAAPAADITLDPSLGTSPPAASRCATPIPPRPHPSARARDARKHRLVHGGVLHPGHRERGFTFSITPDMGGEFTTFEWTFKDPTLTTIASGTGEGSTTR